MLRTPLILGMIVCSWFSFAADSAELQPIGIRQFVSQTFIRGVPYEQVILFDAATVVPILLDMLADPREENHWPNIVITLGMLGDARAVDRLVRFLEADGAGRPLSHTQYIAKTSVPMGLGYLIYKTGDQAALTYLNASLKPDVWLARNVRWLSPYHRTADERNLQLIKMTIIGLGVSGYPSAALALRLLREDPTNEVNKRFGEVILEALSANEAISKEGLAQYDRRSKR